MTASTPIQSRTEVPGPTGPVAGDVVERWRAARSTDHYQHAPARAARQLADAMTTTDAEILHVVAGMLVEVELAGPVWCPFCAVLFSARDGVVGHWEECTGGDPDDAAAA